MYDVIVIGSGPAGMMTSIIASKCNNVLLLEKNNISGKKLLLTGGGRCNLTNYKSNNDFLNMIEHNKKYLYSTINNFGPINIYDYFTSLGVRLKEEEDNKVFPISDKAADILQCLLSQMADVKINYNETVVKIDIIDNVKIISTNKNIYKTKNLVIATGGSSYKDTGSTGDNLKFAKMLNQPVTNIYPAEVGIILRENLSFLAGTTIENVVVKYMKYKKNGNLIFTHKGLSGTSIMLLSEYIYQNSCKRITIDLLPDVSKEELKNMIVNFSKDKDLKSFLLNYFSKKFSEFLVERLMLNIKIKSLNSKNIELLINNIKEFDLEVISTEKIDYAYVTGGGIDLKYINSTTFESKINSGVYFVGEALDIHGPIGGYNITLALSTGYTAGISINKLVSK